MVPTSFHRLLCLCGQVDYGLTPLLLTSSLALSFSLAVCVMVSLTASMFLHSLPSDLWVSLPYEAFLFFLLPNIVISFPSLSVYTNPPLLVCVCSLLV